MTLLSRQTPGAQTVPRTAPVQSKASAASLPSPAGALLPLAPAAPPAVLLMSAMAPPAPPTPSESARPPHPTPEAERQSSSSVGVRRAANGIGRSMMPRPRRPHNGRAPETGRQPGAANADQTP